ncbi:MAG TPA: chromate efflux transporter [Cyclobacteriaceae bacterium]|nr:chromate efflux transporter [Cyclobacteriaceae bacterium]
MLERKTYTLFLRDVFLLALTTFGGAQAHIAHFHKILVARRGYLTEEELMELNSLCQIIPGPTSTQTLTAIGFRLGGPNLAYLTLLVWMLPAVAFMTTAAILMSDIQEKSWSTQFTRFIQPMAVGIVAYGAYRISLRTVKSKTGVVLMILAAVFSYLYQTPFVFPTILLCGGMVTALKYKSLPKNHHEKIVISWSNFALWAGVLILAAALGALTGSLPIRIFENFYRNGSLIFGGGQVLTPLLYTEFVEYKAYLTSNEFLSGYAVAQALPGPVFSFSSYVGSLAMREYGTGGEIVGALMAAFGIFLPGTFLIFFVIRFWEGLKSYRVVRASLEGITAASAGLVAAAAVIMFQPLENSATNIMFTIGTFLLLAFTRIPSPLIIAGGLLLGFVLK